MGKPRIVEAPRLNITEGIRLCICNHTKWNHEESKCRACNSDNAEHPFITWDDHYPWLKEYFPKV